MKTRSKEALMSVKELNSQRVGAGKQQQQPLPIRPRVKASVLLFVRGSDATKKPDFNGHLFSLSQR